MGPLAMLHDRSRPRRPLVDQVAIVTGASGGIGAATARELARRGAAVVLAARRADALDVQVRELRSLGAETVAIPTDVGSTADVHRLVDRTMAAFGRVDVLVNNAGASWRRPLVSTGAEDVSELVGVNLLGAMQVTRAVLPGMIARRHGSIVFVGSLSGRVAMEPLYSATKFGLRGFSLALRRQTAGTGVSVSLVSPGNIRTAMTSDVNARMPGPEFVAERIAELVRRPRREIVIPRQYYIIAWLEQGLPGITDRVCRLRHWSPVIEEEATTWTS